MNMTGRGKRKAHNYNHIGIIERFSLDSRIRRKEEHNIFIKSNPRSSCCSQLNIEMQGLKSTMFEILSLLHYTMHYKNVCLSFFQVFKCFVYMYVNVSQAGRGQERAWVTLELDSQMVVSAMWVLRLESDLL